jgi:wyosine [tRNA(Phe)-imidazoG37] synthetase (radical SAM superfamily)
MRTLYGPVDSWRFGRSLGVDPLARRHKLCPFSCIYCQYGETVHPTVRRRVFVGAERLRADLQVLDSVSADCVTFAGLGEPTLAANLPALVSTVRERHSQPVGLLTGGALLSVASVRRDLACFDWVVVTLNATDETDFRRINRPVSSYPYSLAAIVDGLRRFRVTYSGRLILQIMFIQANQRTASRMADLARTLQPDEIQLNTPLQPALGGPISACEMQDAAQAFEDCLTCTIYDEQTRLSPRSM